MSILTNIKLVAILEETGYSVGSWNSFNGLSIDRNWDGLTLAILPLTNRVSKNKKRNKNLEYAKMKSRKDTQNVTRFKMLRLSKTVFMMLSCIWISLLPFQSHSKLSQNWVRIWFWMETSWESKLEFIPTVGNWIHPTIRFSYSLDCILPHKMCH